MTPDYYDRRLAGVKLDPYRIMLLYGVVHPAHQHAVKKLLRAGGSSKSQRQDVEEVIASLQRWLEMMDEDVKSGVDNANV